MAWRLATQLLAIAIATVFTVSTAVAGSARSIALPGPGFPSLVSLPTGQTTTHGLLPDVSATFPSAQHGWTPQAAAAVSWTSRIGHAARGALVVKPQRAPALVESPLFAISGGLRYSATAWVRGGKKGGVAPAFEFYDATGQRIDAATLGGQVINDSPKWHQLMPVVAFAPQNAVKARVMLIVWSTGATHYVDDVDVAETSGHPTPLVGPLTTQGKDVIDARGRRVVLRGVEVEGLATKPALPTGQILQQVGVAYDWGANLVRLPLDQDRLVPGSCDYDQSYLDTIRTVVAATSARGMLIELDLHTFATKPCGDPRIQPMPNQQSLVFWQQLATAFKNWPLVSFDLWNEPHYTSDKVWRNGGRVPNGPHSSYRAVGMQALYDTVRATGADNLVFLSAPDYATQPSHYPVTGTRNVIGEVHFYTCPTGMPSKAHRCFSPGPHGYTDPTRIFQIWAGIDNMPLFMNEFGWPSRNDGRYDANMINMVEQKQWAGWCAFTFDGSTVGLFDLVNNLGAVQNPAPRGMAVMTGLMRN